MKAKDYYEQFKDNTWDKDDVFQYLMALNAEVTELVQRRGAKRDDALAAIIREINQKHK